MALQGTCCQFELILISPFIEYFILWIYPNIQGATVNKLPTLVLPAFQAQYHIDITVGHSWQGVKPTLHNLELETLLFAQVRVSPRI